MMIETMTKRFIFVGMTTKELGVRRKISEPQYRGRQIVSSKLV